MERLFNVLESVTLVRWPQVGRLKARLTDAGAVCAVMSGSGPTVFGLFSDGRAARAAADAAREDGCWAAVCEAVGPFCQL